MSNTVIKVEDLSKQYRLGDIGTGSMSHDLNRWWHRLRGKENPYLKIGETNDRSTKSHSDYVWSLKDIDFEIKKGDAVGIIGRNGAGKSTLLKILSRVTSPTIGNIKIKGRVASLLEVGTGFHPDLSGKENIFLNGAILGMSKSDIRSKFDEMVAFSGVERYIDTPVKRYSSGMYVRLAFAVAAHLEPDILIVDEVLAVGDAEFQKKCLGKMQDVNSQDGRTVLFVSHNMSAIQSLCTSGILLEYGKVKSQGQIAAVVGAYGATVTDAEVSFSENSKRFGNGDFLFQSVQIIDDQNLSRNEFSIGENFAFRFTIRNKFMHKKAEMAIQVKAHDDTPIFHMMCRDSFFEPSLSKEIETFTVGMKDIRLFPGLYSVTLTCASTTGHEVYDSIEGAMSFTITDGGKYTMRQLPKAAGLFFMNPKWEQS